LTPSVCTAWTDSVIELDFDLQVTEHKVDVIGQFDLSELTYESAIEQVDNILFEKTKQFVANNDLPLKVFLSGGVDTLLVYSYLVRAGANFELIECNHLDHDYFFSF
jgi:asparagine synthetase B (glutamine-hydrolysing)